MNKFMFLVYLLIIVCGLLMSIMGIIYCNDEHVFRGIVYGNLGIMWMIIDKKDKQYE